MRDFIWKVQGWVEQAYQWTRQFVLSIVPHDEDSAEIRSLKLTVFLFVGIIGLMIVIGAITFSIAVRGRQQTLVPNLQGKDVLVALMELKSRELYPDIQETVSTAADKYQVLSQRPAPGTLVKAGKLVTLRVSKGAVLDTVENFVGMSLEDVKAHLQTLFATSNTPNLVIKDPVIYRYEPGVAPGKVLAQSPKAGTPITDVTTLELVVSQDQGAQSQIVVGDYVNKSFDEAMTELIQDDIPFAFTVKKATKDQAAGAVVAQNPAKGGRLAYGQVLQLTMTPPQDVGKDNVFGLFKFTLTEQPIAVNIELDVVSSSGSKPLLAMKHPGGPIAVPYIVPAGSQLVLNVLDQEVARQDASSAQ